MAITTVTGGSRLVRIVVDHTAIDLAEIQTEVTANPGLYSEKVFKLDDGTYTFVDADDNVGLATADVLDAGKAAVDGPVDLSSGAIDYPTFTANVNNLDPGSGTDGVSILKVSNNSGATRQIRGIVAPSTSKTMVIYNDGPDLIRLRNQNGSAIAANRFDIGASFSIQDKEGLWLFYDTVTQRWKRL